MIDKLNLVYPRDFDPSDVPTEQRSRITPAERQATPAITKAARLSNTSIHGFTYDKEGRLISRPKNWEENRKRNTAKQARHARNIAARNAGRK